HALIELIESKFSAGTGLMPDFIEHTNTAPVPTGPEYLENSTDGDYGYNSCRVPWHIGADYIVSGDMRAKAEADKINKWIRQATGGDPSKVGDGYKLDRAVQGSGNSFA